MGGLYAAGRSSDEITELVETLDWSGILGLQFEFGLLTFRRREDAQDFPSELEPGVRGGRVALPLTLSGSCGESGRSGAYFSVGRIF